MENVKCSIWFFAHWSHVRFLSWTVQTRQRSARWDQIRQHHWGYVLSRKRVRSFSHVKNKQEEIMTGLGWLWGKVFLLSLTSFRSRPNLYVGKKIRSFHLFETLRKPFVYESKYVVTYLVKKIICFQWGLKILLSSKMPRKQAHYYYETSKVLNFILQCRITVFTTTLAR